MPIFRTWFIQKRRTISYAIFAVLIGIFLLGRTFFLKQLHVLQTPLVSVATWTSNQYTNMLGSSSIKIGDYKKMLAERNQFAVDRAEFESLKIKNASLEQELGFLKRRGLKGVPASIVSRTVSNQNTTFAIHVGSEEKIIEGSAVIVGDGIYIGKVTHVDQYQSIVTASTDPGVATGVTLFNKTRTIGIAQGSTGNLIELKFIPVDEEIHVNDLVVTSGLEEHVPTGLVVGIVNTVKPDAEAPFQHAILEPLVDIRRYDSIIVLTPTDL